MKRGLWVIVSLLLFLSACSQGGKLTIQSGEVPEGGKLAQAEDLRYAAGFELKGEIPEGESLVITKEQYDRGTKMGESYHKINSTTGERQIGFGVSSSDEEGKRQTEVIYETESGSVETLLEHSPESQAVRSLLEGKTVLLENEPVYLAYWIGSDNGTLIYYSSSEENQYDTLTEQDYCYLLKIERKKE